MQSPRSPNSPRHSHLSYGSGQQPFSPTQKRPAGWGNWLTRVASTAYDTVVGAPPPESYESLHPCTALVKGAEAEMVSPQYGEVAHEERQALWRQLMCTIGRDLMNLRLSLPIWIFEPTTTLVRLAEGFEYAELLESAASNDDPLLRDSLVAAFVISAFPNTERVRKPFNPLLGETFEYRSPVNGMRFYAEQVSHHPPVSVSHCEGRGWASGEVVDIKATFYGNAVEVQNKGERYILLKNTGDRYTWNLPTSAVSNLFIGGAFLDHYGTIELRNETTGTMSRLVLTQCGWFSSGRFEVNGALLNKDGRDVGSYRGAWNKNLDCDIEGKGRNRLWMAGSRALPESEGGGEGGAFAKCTLFTMELLHYESMNDLPKTDSRLRPDRIALGHVQKSKAADHKLQLEQMQRERKKERIEKGKSYSPRWFKESTEGRMRWVPKGDYWDKAHDPDNKLTGLW